jgi:hypothetical protein
MRTGRAVFALLGILGGACGEDPVMTCVGGYIRDGERCVFRAPVTDPDDASVPAADAGPTDASIAPADASPCAPRLWDGSQSDDAGCSADDAGVTPQDVATDAARGEP